MNKISTTVAGLAIVSAMGAASAAPATPLVHTGMCDASAAVAIGSGHFVVANDEDNTLRIYRTDQGGKPVQEFAIPSLPRVPGVKHGEGDIEGAARIGKRIYWIASHGSSRKGEARPHRQQLFATDIDASGGKMKLTEAGRSYTGLLGAMAAYPALKKFDLAAAAALAPESDGGLNIEGLAAMPDGALLIGFRHPVTGGKALLLPLVNPDQLLGINGAAVAAPAFGVPIELDLGGLGIRSIDYAEALKAYLIVAGPGKAAGTFKVFKWAGPGAVPEMLKVDFDKGFRPEALFALADGKTFRVLSDDGDEQVAGKDCKDADPDAQHFRSMNLPLPASALAKPATAPPLACTTVRELSFGAEKVRLSRGGGLDEKANFAVFKAPLAVNTDGAPTSYHPDDFTGKIKALNRLDNGISIRNALGKTVRFPQNKAVFDQWRASPDWKVPAGYRISWSNVIAKDAQGHPCIFKQDNAGYFGSLTALGNGLAEKDAGECQVNNQLDQRVIPAIALRGNSNPLRGYGAKTGDLVLVTNPDNGVMVAAIIGDTGDGDRIGEGSIALNMALKKVSTQPANYSEAVKLDTGARDMIVTVLPGSAAFRRERPYTAENIGRRVALWSQDMGYGSIDKLAAAAAGCASGL